jgi:4-alpha-glucanotransferase
VIGEQLLEQRSSGVLLHATSLPGRYASGDLGPSAHAFAEWLATAEQSWWQHLPIGPPGTGASPYDSPSSFAGSPWLISLELLVRDGLLGADEIAPPRTRPTARARHSESARFREPRLRLAFDRFRARPSQKLVGELERFRVEAADWLDDWALFSALKRAHRGAHWTTFEPELRDRKPAAIRRARRDLEPELSYQIFVQLLFERQWRDLREHCQRLGIALLGDVPMFVAHDGADVWAHRDLFSLDAAGKKTAVAGVPPDAFSSKGQLWGNPLYRWARLQKTGFAWWIARFRTTLRRFDAVRLDHFIGFRRTWQVPARARSAKSGRFVRVPGEALFERVRRELGGLPFVAEDLGLVTQQVHALRERFGLPGMRVLEFAFGPGGSDYLPHRYPRKTVVYTGTHDNDTIVGWFSSLDRKQRARVLAYLGTSGREIHWDLIRLALLSVADVALFPLQDVLGLGNAARMNLPGTAHGNWGWRVRADQLTVPLAERLGELTRCYERAPRAGR